MLLSMELTMDSRCQNTCFNERRPELIQETCRTMVFKANKNAIFPQRSKKVNGKFFASDQKKDNTFIETSDKTFRKEFNENVTQEGN